MSYLQRMLNLLFVYVLIGVLIAAYVYQYVTHQSPCTLCFLQRLSMIGVAAALAMNLRFGIKVQHYGLAIISAALGRVIALKQIEMHISPEFPSLGAPILGLDLYVWAFLIFSCSIFSCAILTIIYGYAKKHTYFPTWGKLDQIAFWSVATLAICNAFTAHMYHS
jgi:disulfide bond formation protein DsbB